MSEKTGTQDSDTERREAERFWKKYDIPFEFGAAIKVRSSGLKRGSWGDGRARDTVVHLHVKESFNEGRLSRSADSYLCEKGSHIDLQGEEESVADGLPKKITCETCLNRMERWKRAWCSSCGETAEGNDRDPHRFIASHTEEDCPADEPVLEWGGPGADGGNPSVNSDASPSGGAH